MILVDRPESLPEDADLDGRPSGSARVEFLGALATGTGRCGGACRPAAVGAKKFMSGCCVVVVVVMRSHSRHSQTR
jgi:hypothetical protein